MGCSLQDRVFGTALMHAHKEEVSYVALCLLVMMGTYFFFGGGDGSRGLL